MQSVGKTREAGALHGGRSPGRRVRFPEVPRLRDRKVSGLKGREGEWEERSLSRDPVEGEPQRS